MHSRLKLLLTVALLMNYPMLAEAMTNADAKSLAVAAYKGNTASLHRLEKSANNGSAYAQFWFGDYYAAQKNYVKSSQWFRKAADQGYAPAEKSLGALYLGGHGLLKNNVKAAYWFKKSADQGYAPAESALGYLYYYGHGVPKNDVENMKWLRKAADQGYAPAEYVLGVTNYNGSSLVPKNNEKAIYWLNKSADQGYSPAKEELEDIGYTPHKYLSFVDLFNVSPYSNKEKKYHIYFSKVVQSISEHEDLLDFQGSYYLASFNGNAPQKGDFISGYCSGLGATRYQSVTNKLQVVPHVLFYKFKAYNLNTPYGQEMSITLLKEQMFAGMSSMESQYK